MRDGPRRRSVGPATEAASEVISTVLTVGITVLLASATAVVVLTLPPPTELPLTDLAIAIDPGASGWGTGDEAVVVHHEGGETLRASELTLRVQISGTTTFYTNPNLGTGFTNGTFLPGGEWRKVLTIPIGAQVNLSVVKTSSDASLVLASASFTSTCGGETAPPFVETWTQSPANVATTAASAVTVTAQLKDACAGVNELVLPRLFWRLGTSGTYTRVDTVRTSTNTFEGTVPNPTWGLQGGKVLEYYLDRMRDLQGNEGASELRSDLVDVIPAFAYPGVSSGLTGTLTPSLGPLQNASDAGATTTLSEAAVTYASPLAFNADAVLSGVPWSNGGNGFVSDNVYATTATTATINYRHADQVGNPGSITKVEVKAEVSISGWANDGFIVQGCVGASCRSVTSSSSLAADTVLTVDLTPADASWTWAKINAIQSNVSSTKIGGADGTWRVDRVWVEVSFTPIVTYAGGVTLEFASVPQGATQVLQLRYARAGETFDVQVWDGASWTTRGAVLDAVALTDWTYTLTASEYNGGAPKVRFVDRDAAGTTQGTLQFDYVRVKTN